MHRTLKFCQHLQSFGWRPVVLTVTPGAYAARDEATLQAVPDDVPVYRAFCLDASRHLSVAGRYPGLAALPDRWVSWTPSGVLEGLRAIRRWRPEVIWSTYPVATAHLIGLALARWSGLPWVADFRDWMTEGDYPSGALRRRLYRRIERSVLKRCDAAVFTTESCRSLYQERYPTLENEDWRVLPNGYDESDFSNETVPRRNKLVLLHSGYLYPDERDPSALFEALARLRDRGRLNERPVTVVFRAPGDENQVHKLARRYGVAQWVRVAPPVAHRDAVREMQQANALLLLQGARFARQVPAKAYEYLRSGRPVLTLAPADSESTRLMRAAGYPYDAPLDAPSEIAEHLDQLLRDLRSGTVARATPAVVRRFDRQHQANRLAHLFEAVANSRLVARADRTDRPGQAMET